PGPGINSDFWSARFTRQFTARAGQYRIILTSDDGSRLFINNQLIIDNWRAQAATSVSTDFFTNGGTMDVRVEFFDRTGGALLRADLITISGGLITGQPTPPTGGGGVCATAPAGMQGQSTATTVLNIRRGPSTQFETMGTLSRCQIVPLSGFRNADSTWIQIITASGQTGWVFGQYMRLGVPVSSLSVTN
ncbi:MAG TPA: PA14 domain-containing protein, partial [Promineifilum sp.]|nr:PA14 domain-containing protein [Promineifilum sp.]